MGAYSQEPEQPAVAIAVPHVFDKEGTEPEGKALNLQFNLHSCFQGQGYKRLKWVFSAGRLGFPLERCSVIQGRFEIELLLLSRERISRRQWMEIKTLILFFPYAILLIK